MASCWCLGDLSRAFTGVPLVQSWDKDCTHLVCNQLEFKAKVSISWFVPALTAARQMFRALVNGTPVVTPAFIQEMSTTFAVPCTTEYPTLLQSGAR